MGPNWQHLGAPTQQHGIQGPNQYHQLQHQPRSTSQQQRQSGSNWQYSGAPTQQHGIQGQLLSGRHPQQNQAVVENQIYHHTQPMNPHHGSQGQFMVGRHSTQHHQAVMQHPMHHNSQYMDPPQSKHGIQAQNKYCDCPEQVNASRSSTTKATSGSGGGKAELSICCVCGYCS